MDGQLICRKCGWINVAGDRFCGSCSAFLEWDGEPGGAAAPVPPVAAPVSPVVAQPVVDAPPVRCTACSIANPATRTFCQSCGARLASAAPIPSRSVEEIAAAVAASHAPAGVVSAPTATVRGKGTPVRSSHGYGGWLMLAVLGIALGVAVVLGANLLQDDGPASGATSAPVTTSAPAAPAAVPGIPGS